MGLTHKMLTSLCLTLCLLAQLSPALPKVGKKPQFSPGQKIVGGNEVEPPHSIPFQVSLQLTEWGDWHFCGGSLLTDKVMAGKHDLYAEEDSEQAAGIASAVIHPQYDPYTTENDICLLQLDTSMKITSAVDVVRPAVTGEQFTGTAR